ncbi:hypothetical protein [Desulfitobacterium sp. AusDCA]|uniref:hypothetical protein n=1 Tax=Desulfitobacterium sp. AusDCA TaxID=3240383 RepID=UPI003DA6D068
MQKKGEPCVLEDRLCTECGDCDRCELDPTKICDNCCKCIDSTADYRGIEIDEILVNTEELKGTHKSVRNYTFKKKSED